MRDLRAHASVADQNHRPTSLCDALATSRVRPNVTAPANCVTAGSTGLVGTLYLDGNSIGSEPGGSDANAVAYYQGPSTLDVRDFSNPPGRDNQSPAFVGQTNMLVLPARAVAAAQTLTAGLIDVCSRERPLHRQLA